MAQQQFELTPIIKLQHQRLGHANEQILRDMEKLAYIGPLGKERLGPCEPCDKAKAKRTPLKGKLPIPDKILHTVHSDLAYADAFPH
jgi:hypothetical protein